MNGSKFVFDILLLQLVLLKVSFFSSLIVMIRKSELKKRSKEFICKYRASFLIKKCNHSFVELGIFIKYYHSPVIKIIYC